MTEPIEQIAARVAWLMGMKLVRDPFGVLRNAAGIAPEVDIRACPRAEPLHHPAEVFRLQCEFNVWPDGSDGDVIAVWQYPRKPIFVSHDNTPESIQQAATRAVLMAVEQILKEKQA